jgi:hypothetical protein
MADELSHVSQGSELTQAEFESLDMHRLDGQTAGDTIYASSTTQLSRLVNEWAKTVAPAAATDDTTLGFVVGSTWIDTTNDKAYICVDNTDGAAVWLVMGYTTADPGATPGGELGGTWDSPTIDTTHSGSTHANLPAGAQVNGTDISVDGHTHATIPSQAVQADIEAETNEDTYIPPDLLKYNPGVAKGWAAFDSAGTLNASYNVSSITDTGTGIWTVNWDTNFSSASYAVVATIRDTSNVAHNATVTVQAAGTTEIRAFDVDTGNTEEDVTEIYVVAFGDQ